MLFESPKQYHGAVYVLAIPSARDRHENVVSELGEGNFEFVYGVDKNDVSIEQFIERGIYDEDLARQADRSSKPMTLGHICCSLGHTMIYETFLESDAERCLIFEDDIVDLHMEESVTAAALDAVPRDAGLIYWGWLGGGYAPWCEPPKQQLYHVYRSLGFLKYDHAMIRNLYSRPFNQYFDIAGKHFCSHAYTVTREAASRLIALNTPIILNADNLLMYAVMGENVRGYVARTRLFSQRSLDPVDSLGSLTQC
jgi:glycosyl transferase, family 25